jgi:hypothetical protein
VVKTRKIKKAMSSLASYLAGFGLGSLVAYGYSIYSKLSALANVKVRPELANVNWWEALLAHHFNDWLWYHYGDSLTLPTVATGGAIGLLAVYLLRKL